MRISNCQLCLVCLILLNLCMLWYFTHTTTPEQQQQQQQHTAQDDMTIVIPSFESFDNDILGTVDQILSLHPNVQILIVCERVPYPYIHLPMNAQFVVQETNPKGRLEYVVLKPIPVPYRAQTILTD